VWTTAIYPAIYKNLLRFLYMAGSVCSTELCRDLWRRSLCDACVAELNDSSLNRSIIHIHMISRIPVHHFYSHYCHLPLLIRSSTPAWKLISSTDPFHCNYWTIGFADYRTFYGFFLPLSLFFCLLWCGELISCLSAIEC